MSDDPKSIDPEQMRITMKFENVPDRAFRDLYRMMGFDPVWNWWMRILRLVTWRN